MESLKTAFFESPTYVYISLAIAELVLAAIWYERRNRRTAMALAVPVLLAGLVFAVEALVVTDREYITAALQAMAEEAETGSGSDSAEFAAGRKYLDDAVRVDLGGSYGGVNLSKAQTIEAARRVLRQLNVAKVAVPKLVVEVDGRRAKTHFTTIITFTSKELGEQRTSLIWDLQWTKREDGWRITRVEKPQAGLEF